MENNKLILIIKIILAIYVVIYWINLCQAYFSLPYIVTVIIHRNIARANHVTKITSERLRFY